MNTPETGVEAGVKTSTPVAQKIGLGVAMLGALTLGASVVLGLIALPKKSPRISPTPLTPHFMSGASLNLTTLSIPNLRLAFGREAVFLGSLNGNTNAFATGSGIPAENTGRSPLMVEMTQGGTTETTLPANLITLTTDGSTITTLCVPPTILPVGAAPTPRYYYDLKGTPYTDALLQTSVACGGGGSGGKQQMTPE